MNVTFVVCVIIIVLLGMFATMFMNKNKNNIWPYYSKKPLSEPELILYHRLIKAMPDNIILAQVQLSRVLGVKKGFNNNEWNNKINRMSLDFLICNNDSSIIAAIELDDKSHEKENRIKADTKKNKALEAANIKLIRLNVKSMPDETKIKELLGKVKNVL